MMQRFWPVIAVLFLVTPAAHTDPETIRAAILGEGTASSEFDLNGDGVVDVADLVSSILLLPKLELLRSSPNNGEQDVAVTRETVLRFSLPLDPGTVDDQTFHAQAAGSDLPVNVHLSPDAKTVTLFYPDHLPPSARVQVLIEESLLRDANGSDTDLNNDGYFAGTVRIEFDTLSLSLLSGTAVYGRVFASEFALSGEGEPVNVPLVGVRISIDGLEDTAFTMTDVNGDFMLEPVPAGRFFVHIDGRTVSEAMIGGQVVVTQFPDGPYYPFVGKAWEAVANFETNIGNIYLPLVTAGSLQAVSPTVDTTIGFTPEVLDEFPELAGVTVTVPADSLFADDGTRGGSVGIAPVPSDRLPGTLPPNLEFPIVITVQTDGATNFDNPAPICFPNLPDPATGQPLAAGQKSALWSFDHDIGRFSVVGPMTASADGLFVCTDPGVGILAPGWHGAASGCPFSSSPPPGKSCEIDAQECDQASLAGIYSCLGPGLAALNYIGAAADGACIWGEALDFFVDTQECVAEGNMICAVNNSTKEGGKHANCAERYFGNASMLSAILSCGRNAIKYEEVCKCPSELENINVLALLGELGYVANLDLHLNLMQGLEDYYLALFGSSDWISVDIESTNPILVIDQARSFFDLFTLQIDVNSPGAGMITIEEAQALRALPLPQGWSPTLVDEFVVRFNLTLDFWAQGILTHEAAGRTDFIDQGEVLAAFELLDTALNSMNSAGIAEIDFARAFERFIDEYTASIIIPPEGFVDQSHIYYSLTDVTNDFVFRGRLDAGGNFGIGGIASDSFFELQLFDSETGGLSIASFLSNEPGGLTHPPDSVFLILPDDPDDDNDGLTLQAELIIGTFPDNPDSDGDGILDGLEVLQGTNPLDGFILQTGIIASIDTDGSASHVHASNDRVVLADGDNGVSLFNVYNGMAPVIIAQVSTGGVVHEVSASGTTLLAISDEIGLSIIDAAVFQTASVVHEVSPAMLKGIPLTVTATGSLAYVGTDSGFLSAIDINTGFVIKQIWLPDPIHGLFVVSDLLYILTKTSVGGLLYIYALPPPLISPLGSVDVEGVGGSFTDPWDLFVGGGMAWVTHRAGYNPIDVSDPTMPLLITDTRSSDFGWDQTVFNGTGLALAAKGSSKYSVEDHNIAMFDASDPTLTLQLITEYTTPDAAVSVEIYNGLAYVADSSAGMHILNYLPSDVAGVSPLVSFTSNALGDQIGEGELIIIDVEASDDGQVRNVELLVDGQVTQTDGNFPFQFYLNAPHLSEASSVALEIRASDTGGNRALSGPQTITILADTTPPVVTGTFPLEDFIAFDAEGVELRFSENIDPVQLNPGGFELLDLGADAVAGGGDDLAVGLVAPTMPDNDSVLLTPSAPLAPGVYQLTVDPAGIVDLAGHPMASPFVLRFGVQQAPPPNVARWVRLSSGQWSDWRNWSSGLPTDNDVVVIDNIGDPITVTLTDSSIITVAGVQCFEDFILFSAGRFEVEGEAFFDRGLQVISDSILVISGAAASLTHKGQIQVIDSEIQLELNATAVLEDLAFGPGTTLLARSGAVLHLPNSTALNGGEIRLLDTGVFDAPLLANIDNTEIEIKWGAQLELPLITSYTTDLPSISAFRVESAESLLDLPALVSIDMSAAGSVFISASDSGVLNLPSVTSIAMPTSQFGLTAGAGGTLTMPLVSLLERTNLNLFGAGSTMNLDAVESMTGRRVDVREGQLNLPNLHSISGALVLMSDAGVFNAPALTNLNDVSVWLGDGSMFNANALTSSVDVDYRLSNGTAFTLQNIAALENSRIDIETGSQFSAPALTSLTLGDVTLDDTGVLTAPLLANINGTRLQLSGGATLTLPLVVQYQTIYSQSGTIFAVEGPGTFLSLPALATLDRSAITVSTFRIESVGGAALDLNALTTVASGASGITRFTADGAGSTIELNALTTFDGTLVEFVETNGGVITRP